MLHLEARRTSPGEPWLNIAIFARSSRHADGIVFRASRNNKTAADYYAAGRSFTGARRTARRSRATTCRPRRSSASSGAIAIDGYDGFLYSIGFLVRLALVRAIGPASLHVLGDRSGLAGGLRLGLSSCCVARRPRSQYAHHAERRHTTPALQQSSPTVHGSRTPRNRRPLLAKSLHISFHPLARRLATTQVRAPPGSRCLGRDGPEPLDVADVDTTHAR
jgi:hypothetical protein